MATLKFKGESPYNRKVVVPKEDYLHRLYEEQVTQDTSAKTKSPPLGAAIFGLGRAGSIHLSNLIGNDRIVLHYIVDDMKDKWDDIKKYWNLTSATFLTSKDQDTVFKDSRVKVVFIMTPTHTHAGIIMKALDSKMPVFCEKPIAENVQSVAKCYEKAKQVGLPLFCAFHKRFDPAYSNLKQRVRQGDIGHVQTVKVVSKDSTIAPLNYLRTSGGVFHDTVVHDIDLTTWLVGELPHKVQATGTAHIPEIKAINDFDTVGILLTFPSGTVGFIETSRFATYGFDQRLEAFGADGMLKVENERPCHSSETILDKEGCTYAPIYYSFPSRFKLAYRNELEHFLNVVQNGESLETHGYQMLAVSKIATAAEKSAKTGETVYLDWSNDKIPAVYS